MDKTYFKVQGKTLQEWRKLYGLTQQQLSDFIKSETGFTIGKVVISSYESGKNPSANFKVVLEKAISQISEKLEMVSDEPFCLSGLTLKEFRTQHAGVSANELVQALDNENITMHMIYNWELKNRVPLKYEEELKKKLLHLSINNQNQEK